MTYTFKYKKLKRGLLSFYEVPALPVSVFGPKGRFETLALLDSGADISAVSINIARKIGLDMNNSCELVQSLNADVSAIPSTMQIRLKRKRKVMGTYLIPTFIINDFDAQIGVLLGRAEFFHHFKITFDEKHQKISFKPS